jgi:hypothetical protein
VDDASLFRVELKAAAMQELFDPALGPSCPAARARHEHEIVGKAHEARAATVDSAIDGIEV